jgi:hypothetical protein
MAGWHVVIQSYIKNSFHHIPKVGDFVEGTGKMSNFLQDMELVNEAASIARA